MGWPNHEDQGDPECECNRRLYSGIPEPMRGPAGYVVIIRMMRRGFPDIHWTLEEMVPEGDKVAARFIMRGAYRSTGGDRIPTRLWCSIKVDRPSRPAGQVWSVLLFAGNTNTTVVLLWRPGMPVGR
jgi:hypothetical protein